MQDGPARDKSDSYYARLLWLLKVLIESSTTAGQDLNALNNESLQFVNNYILEFVNFMKRTPSIINTKDDLNAEKLQNIQLSSSTLSSTSMTNQEEDTATDHQSITESLALQRQQRHVWRRCLISSRLFILRILMSKKNGPTLNTMQVKAIYSSMNTCTLDRDLFQDWMCKCVDLLKPTLTYPVISNIFTSVLYVGTSPSKNITLSGW